MRKLVLSQRGAEREVTNITAKAAVPTGRRARGTAFNRGLPPAGCSSLYGKVPRARRVRGAVSCLCHGTPVGREKARRAKGDPRLARRIAGRHHLRSTNHTSLPGKGKTAEEPFHVF